MRRRNLFLLQFNGRDDNIGDQFIFRALVDALRPLGTVLIRGGLPSFVEGAVSVRKSTLPITTALARLRGCKVYAFNSPGARYSTKSAQRKRSRLLWLKFLLFNVLGGSRVAVGNSVMPGGDQSWCLQLEWIGVRDRASLAVLQAAGMERCEYFPDLAFLPPRPPLSDAPRGKACFSFRQFVPDVRDTSGYGSSLRNAVAGLASSISQSTDLRPEFFYQVVEDQEFTAALSSETGISLHSDRISLTSFGDYFASAGIVVSNRLHCLLLGALCGAVPIALTSRDHTKLVSLFETVGWESLLLYLDESPTLADQLAAICHELPAFRSLVAETFDHHRRLGLDILERRFGDSPERETH